jgi:hypothetical protein
MSYKEDEENKDKFPGNNPQKSDYIIKEAHRVVNNCARNHYERNKKTSFARVSSIKYKTEDMITGMIKAALFLSVALLVFVILLLI